MFSDAFSEIDQLKADIETLKRENAQLHVSFGTQEAVQPSSDLEARVSALEISFGKLQSTLGQVVIMLTALLSKLQ